jgi:SnoaL-like domain
MDLQALSDRMEIVDVHIRHGRSLDTKDWSLIRTVFTEDAYGDFWVGGQHHGIEAIIHASRSTMENLDGTQHLLSNHEVNVVGVTATARVDLLAGHVLRVDGADSSCTVRGYYRDELVRTDEGWRISRRELTVTWIEGDPSIFELGSAARLEGSPS